MKTQTTEEAFELLKSTRAGWITRARDIAREICQRDGDADTCRVFKEMHLDIEAAGIKPHFLGVVFNHRDFTPTGEWRQYSKAEYPEAKNTHSPRQIRIWKLAEVTH